MSAKGVAYSINSLANSLMNTQLWINNLAAKVVIGTRRRGKAQHHERVTSCTHQVITLFDDLAVLAVIKSEFLPLRDGATNTPNLTTERCIWLRIQGWNSMAFG
jgi:hypothetical protein